MVWLDESPARDAGPGTRDADGAASATAVRHGHRIVLLAVERCGVVVRQKTKENAKWADLQNRPYRPTTPATATTAAQRQ